MGNLLLPEDLNAQRDFAKLNDAILQHHGITLSKDSVILDYGCGTGRVTYDYMDAGYPNTYGYDVKNYLTLRDEADLSHFKFDDMEGPVDSFPPMSRIPWPDDTFDFIFATSVFEHVMDQELAYREICRVLKPGGIFLNNFPSKWRPIEPHIYVPFGGALQWKWYYRLWAMLGVRNEYQQGLGSAEVAARNYKYSQVGIKYPSGNVIGKMMQDIFGSYEYADIAFMQASPGRARHIAGFAKAVPFVKNVFRSMHTRIIIARKT